MGRPSSCCCLCGNCKKPLAIGVMPGQMEQFDSPPQVNSTAGFSDFRLTWGREELTWAYGLQTADELLDSDFLSLRNGRIDCVIVGDTPSSIDGDVSTADTPGRYDRVWFPTPDSDDEDAIFAYLAAGGNVIVKNSFPRMFSTYFPPTTVTERSYSADKQDEMATFLSRLSSGSEFIMEEDCPLPYPYRTYVGILPPSSVWTVNPDNLLGRGSRRYRTRSTWAERIRQDAYHQTGVDWDTTGGFTNVVATDLSANPSQTITSAAAPWGGRLTTKLTNPNQEDWFLICPMASGSFPSGTFSSTTHLQDDGFGAIGDHKRFRRYTDGQMELNGHRYIDVLCTAERLPGGGNLIVTSPSSSARDAYTKNTYHMALEALQRLLSGCDGLGRKSTTLFGSA